MTPSTTFTPYTEAKASDSFRPPEINSTWVALIALNIVLWIVILKVGQALFGMIGGGA